MTSKIWAISKPSETIALKYGKNVSKGIKEMEKLLEKYRDFTKGLKGAGDIE